MQLTFGMYGDGDFFTMKGVIEELLYQTGLRKKAQYDPHAELPFLHPGRKAAIVYDGAVIGISERFIQRLLQIMPSKSAYILQ